MGKYFWEFPTAMLPVDSRLDTIPQRNSFALTSSECGGRLDLFICRTKELKNVIENVSMEGKIAVHSE
jgi:hypothetical protein